MRRKAVGVILLLFIYEVLISWSTTVSVIKKSFLHWIISAPNKGMNLYVTQESIYWSETSQKDIYRQNYGRVINRPATHNPLPRTTPNPFN